MSAPPDVSVVIPFLNEEAGVRELLTRLRHVLEEHSPSFELVLVDDGSSDATLARLRDAEASDRRLRVFELTRNFGQNSALACGLFESRGAVIVTMDADLQNPPEEIPKLVSALEGCDVATGLREQRFESPARWLGSRGINWVACKITGVEIEDFGGQFKAYRRHVVEEMRRNWTHPKPLFPLALWLGFRVAEVPVRHEPRQSGVSSYTLPALVRIAVNLLTSFSTLPLAMARAAGFWSFAVGSIGIAYWLMAGRAGVFVPASSLTLFGFGAVLFATSMLGPYPYHRNRQVAGREPAFVIRNGPMAETAESLTLPGVGTGSKPALAPSRARD